MDSEDVLTLDYAYSEAFAFLAGSHVAQLLKRLAGPISLSVESYSLRQAILAYAAAFNPSHGPYNQLMQRYHSNATTAVLKALKAPGSLDESDLLSACLSLYLACISWWFDTERFSFHAELVKSIMKQLRNKIHSNAQLRLLWPIIHDLLVEGGRVVFKSNIPALGLLDESSQMLGFVSYSDRVGCLSELYGQQPSLRRWHSLKH